MTAQKEGCSDLRAVADYMDPMVFDPVMASVQVCVSELGEDEIAVNHLRVDMEEGETVTLKPLLPKKFKDATLSWGLEYGGAVILKAAEDGKSATITGGNVVDWDQVGEPDCHPARWNRSNGDDDRRCEVREAGCEGTCPVGRSAARA